MSPGADRTRTFPIEAPRDLIAHLAATLNLCMIGVLLFEARMNRWTGARATIGGGALFGARL